MPKPTVLLCMGTRPEIIKMAPVYHALRESPLRPVVVHTGQHDEIARPLYDAFGMEPDHTPDLVRERPTLGHLGARLLDAVDGVVGAVRPAAVLVHGDTSSALASALAAFYAGVPVGHVEAGLRSGDPANPFPEEANRTLIARLARWHFAPTRGAVRNLLGEGCDPASVSLVGNTVVDAVRHTLATLRGVPDGLPDELEAWAGGGRLVVVTMHRRESWGRPIESVAAAVAAAVRARPDLRVVWPVHPNPDVQVAVERGLAGAGLSGEAADRVRRIAPLDYPSMLWALRAAWLVLTDSGGIQEEAAALGRPVLVLRETTERPELIEAGGGVLVGASGTAVRRWLLRLADDAGAHAALACAENPYGDGRTGARIAALLVRDLAGPAARPSRRPALVPPALHLATAWPPAVAPAA